MRTRLAPLIVVKQEPKDELSPLEDLNNNNNNINFLSSSSSLIIDGGGGGGSGGTSPALQLPTPPAAVPATPQMATKHQNIQGTPLETPSMSFSGYGGDSNNNRSCEVNKNIFGGGGGRPSNGNEEHIFLRSVVEGIKVEKCFYSDRNNNNCDWFQGVGGVGVKAEDQQELQQERKSM